MSDRLINAGLDVELNSKIDINKVNPGDILIKTTYGWGGFYGYSILEVKSISPKKTVITSVKGEKIKKDNYKNLYFDNKENRKKMKQFEEYQKVDKKVIEMNRHDLTFDQLKRIANILDENKEAT